MVPREDWGDFENAAPTGPLNLDRERPATGPAERSGDAQRVPVVVGRPVHD